MHISYKKIRFDLQYKRNNVLPSKRLNTLEYTKRKIECILHSYYSKLFVIKRLYDFSHVICNLKRKKQISKGPMDDVLSIRYRGLRVFRCKYLHTLTIQKKRVDKRVFYEFLYELKRNRIAKKKKLAETLIYRPRKSFIGKMQSKIVLRDTLGSKQMGGNHKYKNVFNTASVTRKETVLVNLYYLTEKIRDVLKIRKLFSVVKLYSRKDGTILRAGDVVVKVKVNRCVDEYCGLLCRGLAMAERKRN